MSKRRASIAERLRANLWDVEVDAKRRPGAESGVEAWYRYYAGFTEQFAETVLEAAALPEGSVVLDPWNGSGTTTSVADAKGLTGIGIDINPVATLVASAKLARSQDATYVSGLANRVARSSLREQRQTDPADPLRRWLCLAVTEAYRAIERGVLSDLAVAHGGVPLSPASDALPPLASLLLLALQRAARGLAGIRTTSNPTWVRPEERPPEHPPSDLASEWLRVVREMARDLRSIESTPRATGTRVLLGDSRSLPLDDNWVDLVVTSPPYCTRIDYVVSTSFELAALGIGPENGDFDSLRRGCMGTPLARRTGPLTPESFPQSVQSLLRAIREHPSKASGTYYYKTYAQYFSDSVDSIRELARVLATNGAAVLVLQSSYYKDVYVDLPALYAEMAAVSGLEAAVVAEVDVTKFLAQINSRSTAHRTSTRHREAVLVLEKGR